MMGVRAGLNGGIRWVSALAGLCGCWCAEGADRAPTGEQVRLVAERAAVTAGAPFTLAVELRTRPGWHTYWMNPGDSGLAPALRWQLPDGVRLTGVAFPVPERIEEEGANEEKSAMVLRRIRRLRKSRNWSRSRSVWSKSCKEKFRSIWMFGMGMMRSGQ